MMKWQARRDSNPQLPDLESGTLPIRVTGLPTNAYPEPSLEQLKQMIQVQSQKLFRLFMRSMGPAKPAIFFKLQFIRSISLVLGCRIITTLTCSTCKSNNISHNTLPRQNETTTSNILVAL